jgi:hypothetical protein
VDDNTKPMMGIRYNAETVADVIDEQTTLKAMADKYGERNKICNLTPRRPRNYSHLHAMIDGIAMTQHSVKKGLKEFGDAGTQAVLKEMQQVHNRDVLDPKHSNKLTQQQQHNALRYLMFLKKKQYGTIKGCGCATERKQREYTTKEETSSPTVAIESLMLSCIIDAKEGRNVATANIPGTFMQTDMVDTVHMVLEGTMAELLVKN